jgi:hypothetical protein
LAFGTLCVTCVASLYTTTYRQLDVEIHRSTFVSNLGLALFVWGFGLSPMVLEAISELYRRRPVYTGEYFFTNYLVNSSWSVRALPQLVYRLIGPGDLAAAKNIATMLVSRFLDGLAGSTFLSVVGGSVGACSLEIVSKRP